MSSKIVYKLELEGNLLFSTESKDLFIQVREDVKLYLERYGKQGIEDYVAMLVEEYE